MLVETYHKDMERNFVRSIWQVNWSKYPGHKSKRINHLNIESSEILTIHRHGLQNRCDQVLASSKHHLSDREFMKLTVLLMWRKTKLV